MNTQCDWAGNASPGPIPLVTAALVIIAMVTTITMLIF